MDKELPNGHIIRDGIEMKKCSHEKQYRPITLFSKRKASKDGLSYNCKNCDNKIAMSSYKNRKKEKKRKQTYEENRDKWLQYARDNYQKNREARLEQGRLYRLKNPEIARESDRRRREALKKAEKDGVTRSEIIKRDSQLINGTLVPICQICMKPVESYELQIDHIIPVNQGGADTASNKRVTHKVCNASRAKDGRDLGIDGQTMSAVRASAITVEDMRRIRILRDEGFDIEEISKELNITKNKVEAILTGKVLRKSKK